MILCRQGKLDFAVARPWGTDRESSAVCRMAKSKLCHLACNPPSISRKWIIRFSYFAPFVDCLGYTELRIACPSFFSLKTHASEVIWKLCLESFVCASPKTSCTTWDKTPQKSTVYNGKGSMGPWLTSTAWASISLQRRQIILDVASTADDKLKLYPTLLFDKPVPVSRVPTSRQTSYQSKKKR